MAYDAARSQIVLFGGYSLEDGEVGDTWTWDGTDWTQHPAGSAVLRPRSGPPGTSVFVEAWGFASGELIKLTFVDTMQGRTLLWKLPADESGARSFEVTIPLTATPGKQHIQAKGMTSGQVAECRFTVT
jgi:hypothetical protein